MFSRCGVEFFQWENTIYGQIYALHRIFVFWKKHSTIDGSCTFCFAFIGRISLLSFSNIRVEFRLVFKTLLI